MSIADFTSPFIRNMCKRSIAGTKNTVFLVDSVGALMTIVFLLLIKKSIYQYVGMQQYALTLLASAAFFFCLYSVTCYFMVKGNWMPFLKAIIIANILYCILTLGLVFTYFESLTTLGFVYFLTEIVVICGLVYIEIQVFRNGRTR